MDNTRNTGRHRGGADAVRGMNRVHSQWQRHLSRSSRSCGTIAGRFVELTTAFERSRAYPARVTQRYALKSGLTYWRPRLRKTPATPKPNAADSARSGVKLLGSALDHDHLALRWVCWNAVSSPRYFLGRSPPMRATRTRGLPLFAYRGFNTCFTRLSTATISAAGSRGRPSHEPVSPFYPISAHLMSSS